MATSLDTYTYNDNCSNCHSSYLGLAHKDTSTTANLGSGRTAWNSTTQSTCRDCHNAPAATGYAASGERHQGQLDDRHLRRLPHHQARHLHRRLRTRRRRLAARCRTGCHGYSGSQSLDIRALHDKATAGCTANGTDSKGWTGGCHASTSR